MNEQLRPRGDNQAEKISSNEHAPEAGRLGPAVWKNSNHNRPITVVGYLPPHDGKEYVLAEDNAPGNEGNEPTPLPLDEISFKGDDKGDLPIIAQNPRLFEAGPVAEQERQAETQEIDSNGPEKRGRHRASVEIGADGPKHKAEKRKSRDELGALSSGEAAERTTDDESFELKYSEDLPAVVDARKKARMIAKMLATKEVGKENKGTREWEDAFNRKLVLYSQNRAEKAFPHIDGEDEETRARTGIKRTEAVLLIVRDDESFEDMRREWELSELTREEPVKVVPVEVAPEEETKKEGRPARIKMWLGKFGVNHNVQVPAGMPTQQVGLPEGSSTREKAKKAYKWLMTTPPPPQRKQKVRTKAEEPQQDEPPILPFDGDEAAEPDKKRMGVRQRARGAYDKAKETPHRRRVNRVVEQAELAQMSPEDREVYLEAQERRKKKRNLILGGAGLFAAGVVSGYLATRGYGDGGGFEINIDTGQDEINDLKDQLDNREDQLENKQERIDELKERVENTQDRLENVRDRLQDLRNDGGDNDGELTRSELFDGRGRNTTFNQEGLNDFLDWVDVYQVKGGDTVWDDLSKEYLKREGNFNPSKFEIDAAKDKIVPVLQSHGYADSNGWLNAGDTIKLK